MNIRDHINTIIKAKSLLGFSFIKLYRYESVLKTIGENFLQNGVADLKQNWWWEYFNEPATWDHPKNPLEYISDILKNEFEYYFIASEENGKYWVAEGTGKDIKIVINEMYGFEYYVANKKLTWLMSENHHNVFSKTSKNQPV